VGLSRFRTDVRKLADQSGAGPLADCGIADEVQDAGEVVAGGLREDAIHVFLDDVAGEIEGLFTGEEEKSEERRVREALVPGGEQIHRVERDLAVAVGGNELGIEREFEYRGDERRLE
jgi:hypothetical protein